MQLATYPEKHIQQFIQSMNFIKSKITPGRRGRLCWPTGQANRTNLEKNSPPHHNAPYLNRGVQRQMGSKLLRMF